MGTRDTVEQLEAAIAECVRLERELAAAQADLVWVRTWAERAGGVTDDEMDELRSYASASRTDALNAAIGQAKAEALLEAADELDRCHCVQADDEGNQIQAQDCPHHGDSTAQYVGQYVVLRLRGLADSIEREGADRAE